MRAILIFLLFTTISTHMRLGSASVTCFHARLVHDWYRLGSLDATDRPLWDWEYSPHLDTCGKSCCSAAPWRYLSDNPLYQICSPSHQPRALVNASKLPAAGLTRLTKAVCHPTVQSRPWNQRQAMPESAPTITRLASWPYYRPSQFGETR